MKPKNPGSLWQSLPWLFFATAFESFIAAFLLLQLPTEGGFSASRIGLLGIPVLIFSGCIILGFKTWQNRKPYEWVATLPIIPGCAVLSILTVIALFLLRYLNPAELLPYYQRLSPVLWLFFIMGLEFGVFLQISKNNLYPDNFKKRAAAYRSSVVPIAILWGLFIFVVMTRLGLIPDTAYWGEPGSAIQGWQFLLSILAGFTLLQSFVQKSEWAKKLIPVSLYLLAAGLWLSVPVEVLQNSFYSPITPPANIPFPYSDAGFYDYLSQSLLIGTDYLGGIPPRPLYVTFLAILHYLLGQNYPAIIALQTLALAFFPVGLYFLAKKFHTPAAGVTVALFAIFRELTSLWISSNTRVVNSKILTTDFPTAMSLVFLCLAAAWWLERRDWKSSLTAGGVFGLVLLLRTQSLLVLPPLLMLAGLAYWGKWKQWLAGSACFTLAALLTVLPWLVHNYGVEGQFTFDDPRQSAVIYSQYSLSGNLDLSQYDPKKDSLRERILTFTIENPGKVANFITSHILNTEIGGVLALPLIEEFEGLNAPVNLYWVSWNGQTAWYNALLIMFYLAVIGLGVGAAWQRAGWVGLLPVAINLGYTLANGISRFSGWRYNLPVDWVFYFYFGIGALELLGGVVLLLGGVYENIFPKEKQAQPGSISISDWRVKYALLLAAFVCVGFTPWLAKGLSAPRYTATDEALISTLAGGGHTTEEISAFLSKPGAVLAEGRLLYPHLYRRKEGMSSANPWPAYAVQDFSRIGFILLNQKRSDMLFATREVLDFPQGSDAIILACEREGYFEVRLIDFGTHRYENAPLTAPCTGE